MTRLDLADGQWIDVREKLKVRDKAFINAYSVRGLSEERMVGFNVVNYNIAHAAVRITAWAIKDDKGRDIAYPGSTVSPEERAKAICALDEDIFEPIADAIDAYVKSKALVTEKNETADGVTA